MSNSKTKFDTITLLKHTVNSVVEMQKENKELLKALKVCVARLKNEIHASFAILEAERVIDNINNNKN